MKRNIVLLVLLALMLLTAREACAVDILEIRVKRLYQEAEEMASRGDYDGALESYNKAIGYAKDKDIRQFLMNAKKELQKKRREKPGTAEVAPPEERKTAAAVPAAVIPEKAVSGVTPEEMKKVEYAPPVPPAPPTPPALSVSPAMPAEEAKPAKEAVAPEDKTKLLAEKIRAEQAEREAKFAEEQKAKEAGVEGKKVEEAAPLAEEISSAGETVDADLEQRKAREAEDRAVYENSTYRYKVKQILDNAYNKFQETSTKIETEEKLKQVESKLNKLTALNNQAEEFMAEGQYEKARELYEKILALSKDRDLEEYIKKQKGD